MPNLVGIGSGAGVHGGKVKILRIRIVDETVSLSKRRNYDLVREGFRKAEKDYNVWRSSTIQSFARTLASFVSG